MFVIGKTMLSTIIEGKHPHIRHNSVQAIPFFIVLFQSFSRNTRTHPLLVPANMAHRRHRATFSRFDLHAALSVFVYGNVSRETMPSGYTTAASATCHKRGAIKPLPPASRTSTAIYRTTPTTEQVFGTGTHLALRERPCVQ